MHVDVFQLNAKFHLTAGDFLANFGQCFGDLLSLGWLQKTDAGEHLSVGDGALDVVRVEPAVEADAFGELLNAAIRRLGKNS